MATRQSTSEMSRPAGVIVIRVMAAVALLVFVGFFITAIIAGSLGAGLLMALPVFFGAISLFLLFARQPRWAPKLKHTVTTAAVVLFAASGYWSFHILWKYVQPTLLPKKATAIGSPWVKENNIFTDNDYNNAVVIKLADGTYRMYFHDHKDNMLTASSKDGQHFGNVTTLFQGQMPTVVQTADGRYRMYYFVNANMPPAGPRPSPSARPMPVTGCGDNCPAAKHNLVSAISSDGLHWTQEPGVRLGPSSTGYDATTMIHPTVIRLSDGSYKLYYDGEIDDAHSYSLSQHYRKILSASSKDGLTWTRDPGYRIDEKPLHTFEAYSPKAMYQDGKVILHFTTPNGIYEATSTDTLHFTISKNPVFSPGRIPMPGDDGALGSYQDAYVLPDPSAGGNRIYFWIDGKGIFYAFQKT